MPEDPDQDLEPWIIPEQEWVLFPVEPLSTPDPEPVDSDAS